MIAQSERAGKGKENARIDVRVRWQLTKVFQVHREKIKNNFIKSEIQF